MYRVTDSGVLKKLETWHLVVPRHDNNGQPFSKATMESVLEDISLNFPGFTMVNCTGYWSDAGKTYVDDNVQIVIDALATDQDRSRQFFARLKQDLATKLKQEKIYITQTSDKEEFISLDEFFEEVGVVVDRHASLEAKQRLAEQLVSRFDVVIRRMGYRTLALRRDPEAGTIIWERELCGIILKSELDDHYPQDVKLIAADQIDRLSELFFGDGRYAIIGDFEFQFYALDRMNYRPLVPVDAGVLEQADDAIQYFTPRREPVSLERFIEEFTMGIITNYAVLRDEGFLEREIYISVGSDGSVQVGDGEPGRQVFLSPAGIADEVVQHEIIRCVREACIEFEDGTLDPVALQQAKAKNNYILKRAVMRRLLIPRKQWSSVEEGE